MPPSGPSAVIDLCDSDDELPTENAQTRRRRRLAANESGKLKERPALPGPNIRRLSKTSAEKSKISLAKSKGQGSHDTSSKFNVQAQSTYARNTTASPAKQIRQLVASEREAVNRKARASASEADKRTGRRKTAEVFGDTDSNDELPSADTFITPGARRLSPAAQKVAHETQGVIDRPDFKPLRSEQFGGTKRPRENDNGAIANKRQKRDIRNDHNALSSSSDSAFGQPPRRKTPPRSQPQPGSIVDLVTPVKRSTDIITILSDDDDNEVLPPRKKASYAQPNVRSGKSSTTTLQRDKEPRPLLMRKVEQPPTTPERSTTARRNASNNTYPRSGRLGHPYASPKAAQNRPVDIGMDIDQGYGSLASNSGNIANDKTAARSGLGNLDHGPLHVLPTTVLQRDKELLSGSGQNVPNYGAPHIQLETSVLDATATGTQRLANHLENDAPHASKTLKATTDEQVQLRPKARRLPASDSGVPASESDVPTRAAVGSNNESALTRQAEQLPGASGNVPIAHKDTNTEAMPASSLAHVLSKNIEVTLGRRLEERRGDNEYWNKVWLKRARLSVKSSMPPVHTAAEAPYSFAAMKPLQLRPVVKAAGKTTQITVEFSATTTPSTKRVKSTVSVPVTLFRTRDSMPTYSHAVGIKGNFLAANVTSLQSWPYFDDTFDYSKADSLQEHYHLDIHNRETKLERLVQAQSLERYVEDVLQELGLVWDDVLRFLLEDSPDVGLDPDAIQALQKRYESCTEEFSRQNVASVLSSLHPSSTEKLGKAAVLCDTFRRMVWISLWHVARKHLPKAVPNREDTGLLDRMTCSICLRFDCPYHGEQEESEQEEAEQEKDEQDEGEQEETGQDASERGGDNASSTSSTAVDMATATDIINPPKVNYKTRIAFPPIREIPADSPVAAPLNKYDRRSSQYWRNANFVHEANERGPFYPCYHPRQSCDAAVCSCYKLKLACEKTCSCSSDCARKFQGCACFSGKKAKKGGKLVCFVDDRCVCFNLGRECDPDLCGTCGVCEVLDPVNRYNDDVQEGRCRNAAIQQGVPKRTLLGDSGIHGFGLYAGENIKRHEFVGEYKGEIITTQEAERRGAVYEHQGLSYLFSLNKTQEIDSTSFGNKIRFVNHAPDKLGRPGMLFPRIFMVNTVHRIAMFAERKIDKGVELLFDYGPMFPDQKLEGNAPHVRNANLVRNDFYDVEDVVDELGHRRARKAVKAKGKLLNEKSGVSEADTPPQRGEARYRASRMSRKSAPEHGAEDDDDEDVDNEGNDEKQDKAVGISAQARAARLLRCTVFDETMAYYALDVDARHGAEKEEDDFDPGESPDEASEASAEGVEDEDEDDPASSRFGTAEGSGGRLRRSRRAG
ncbi:hypothetical protein LTR08_001667 [Meristemomyces frigidus]|nr:hypothetical protein LTR08_001667 [Meristemomyces frigidus]